MGKKSKKKKHAGKASIVAEAKQAIEQRVEARTQGQTDGRESPLGSFTRRGPSCCVAIC